MWFCRFFKESSEEEREHAEKLMQYQVLNLSKTIYSFENYLKIISRYFIVPRLDAVVMYFSFSFSFRLMNNIIEHKRRKSEATLYSDAAFRI